MKPSRMGALVFAAGLGWATITGAGTATADSPDTDSLSRHSSSESSETSPDASPGDSARPSTPTRSTESTDASAAEDPEPGDDAPDDADLAEDGGDELSGGELAEDELAEDGGDELSEDGAAPDIPDSPIEDGSDAERSETADDHLHTSQPGTAVWDARPAAHLTTNREQEPEFATAEGDAVAGDDAELQRLAAEVSADVPPEASVTSVSVINGSAPETQPVKVQRPVAARPAAKFWSALGSIVSDVLGVVQSLAAFPGGKGSGEPTLAWVVAAFVRREVGRILFNSDPTAAPVQIVQTGDGLIRGAVNAFDVDGDRLTYRLVSAPRYGTVVVDADGWYTYTPGTGLTAAGGVDTFTVEVSDDGFRLPFLGTTGKAEVPVSVTLTAPNGPTVAVGNGPVRMALSPDGSRAYVLVADQTVSVIDTAIGSATRGTVTGTIYVGAAQYVEDDSGTPVAVIQDSSELSAIAFSPNGKRLYVVNSTAGTATVIDTDLASPGLHCVLDTFGVGAGPTAIALSPDGSVGYVVNGTDGNVWVIDTATNRKIGVIDVGRRPSAAAVSPDGSTLYVTNFADDSVSVIDTSTGTVTATLAVGGRPTDVVVSADGRRVYTANFQSNSVSVIDPTTGKVTDILVGGSPSALALSPDGNHLYVTESYANRVAVIDLAARAVVTRIAVGDGPEDLALSADGKRAFVSNLYDGTLSELALDPLPVAAPATQLLGSTKGFHVYNVGGEQLTLTLRGGIYENGGPGLGTVVAPGTYLDFEVVKYFFDDNLAYAYFSLPDGQQPYYARMFVFGLFYSPETGCGAASPRQCQTNGDRLEIYLLDAPGTVIKLDGPSGQQQAQILNQLCYAGSLATCDFDSSRGELYYNDPVPAPGSLINDTSVEQRREITVSREITNTISWKLTFKAETGEAVKRIVNLSFQVEFGHQWSEKRTFTDRTTVIVPPHTAVRVYSSDPVDRLYGRFVLTMYNTTWDLTNVYFDSADKVESGILTYKETPITTPAVS